MTGGADRAATMERRRRVGAALRRRRRVGAALRRRREQRGLRISRLPVGFPVHYQRLSRIERGVAVVDAGELAALLFALDWTDADLDAEMGRSGVLGTLPPEVAGIVPLWAATVDWHLSDSEIGRQLSLSRERVRRVRAKLIELGQPLSTSARK